MNPGLEQPTVERMAFLSRHLQTIHKWSEVDVIYYAREWTGLERLHDWDHDKKTLAHSHTKVR